MKQPELPWIAHARKYVGVKETPGPGNNSVIMSWLKKLKSFIKDDATPWCGTYVAECLSSAGIPIPRHWYRALDYLNFGTKLDKPAYGSLAIKTRKGGGHVTFVVGITPKGKLVCLGGNQSDSVCYALYDKSEFTAFHWYGTQKYPASFRYDLPVITNVTATKVTEL